VAEPAMGDGVRGGGVIQDLGGGGRRCKYISLYKSPITSCTPAPSRCLLTMPFKTKQPTGLAYRHITAVNKSQLVGRRLRPITDTFVADIQAAEVSPRRPLGLGRSSVCYHAEGKTISFIPRDW
jgi:hypothetical protein